MKPIFKGNHVTAMCPTCEAVTSFECVHSFEQKRAVTAGDLKFPRGGVASFEVRWVRAGRFGRHCMC